MNEKSRKWLPFIHKCSYSLRFYSVLNFLYDNFLTNIILQNFRYTPDFLDFINNSWARPSLELIRKINYPTFRRCLKKNNIFLAIVFGELFKISSYYLNWNFGKLGWKLFIEAKKSKIVGYFINMSWNNQGDFQQKR